MHFLGPLEREDSDLIRTVTFANKVERHAAPGKGKKHNKEVKVKIQGQSQGQTEHDLFVQDAESSDFDKENYNKNSADLKPRKMTSKQKRIADLVAYGSAGPGPTKPRQTQETSITDGNVTDGSDQNVESPVEVKARPPVKEDFRDDLRKWIKTTYEYL